MIQITVSQVPFRLRKLLTDNKFQHYHEVWNRTIPESLLNEVLEAIRPERDIVYARLKSVYHSKNLRITLRPEDSRKRINYYDQYLREVGK